MCKQWIQGSLSHPHNSLEYRGWGGVVHAWLAHLLVTRYAHLVEGTCDHCMAAVVDFSYDVVFTAGADVILERFMDFNCRVVFSAEGFCWPDQSLAVSVGL